MSRNAHEAAGEVAVSLGQGWLVSPVLGGDSCPQLLGLCQQRCLGAGPGSHESGWLPSILHARKRCLSRDTNTTGRSLDKETSRQNIWKITPVL